MPGHSPFLPHDDDEPPRAPPRAARLLIAVPWRHAGLITLCAVAGGMATTMASARHPRVVAAATKVRSHVPQRVELAFPPEASAASALKLDLEPGAILAGNEFAQVAEASAAPASVLRLDDAREPDDIDAALRDAPPAAGRLVDDVPANEARRVIVALPGLIAGLLLGLLLAALRELRGGRMRSPREAEWALGAPVLGAIPTLSAKARDAAVTGPVPLDGPLERE